MERKFLEDLGLDKETVDKIMAENASDIEAEKGKFEAERTTLQGQISDLQGQAAQRDTDLNDLKEKLTAAQADASKLPEAQSALTGLQSKYDTEKKEWETKSAQQAYEFAVKMEAGKLKFSSAAAQRDFVRGAIEKGMKLEGEKILGFADFVEAYKKDDPGAFHAEQQDPPPDGKPHIVLPPSGKPPAPDGKGFNFHFTGVRPMPAETK
jgi:chromosome segregation ATPase